ncbi:MAG: NUDIX domain-containing protein [Clostridia bacterium]|nr:NUDIX domain-containing protein [Clostridia bacterium]
MKEMLETFDREGNFVGVKSRTVCHSSNPGVFHKTVLIWMKNDEGMILVQKRSKNKKQAPGLWDTSSAGHVPAGETCLQTCVRETREELGIDVQESDFLLLGKSVENDSWEIAHTYLLKNNTKLEDLKIQKEEVDEVKWLNYEEFVELLHSEKFHDHGNNYSTWVAELLKDM